MTNPKQIIRLALPMVVAQLAFASMSFIDTLLMGRLGVATLAGGGLGAVVYQFFYVVGIGVLVATSNLIAFAKGQDRPIEIQQALLSGVIVVLLLFGLFGMLIWNIKPILLAFGQAPETVFYAEQYLRVVVWALLPAFVFILLRSLVLGVGNPNAILPISICGAVLNYPISFALMTGQWGLPPMGIGGIALGTCIITFGMASGLMWLVYRRPEFAVFPFWARWEVFSFAQLKATFRLGVPIALAHAMEIGLFSAAALLMGLVSVNALAAHQVALQCATLTFMIPLGISQAVSVQIGQSLGARNLLRIKQVARHGLVLATISAMVAGSLFWLVPEWLISLFLRLDNGTEYQAVLSMAVSIMFVAALFQLVDAWQVTLMGILRGFKLGVSPTVVAVIGYWLVGFPCSYWLMNRWGAIGVWAGLGIGLAASSIMLYILFINEIRKLSRIYVTSQDG